MLNVAVIGIGWWGKVIVQTIRSKSRRLHIVRCVEPNVDAVKGFCAEQGVPVSADYEDALRDPAVQAVILTIPHSLHESFIIRAAQAGKHVFCEKPLTLSLETSRRAVAAVKQAGVQLGIGHERRFEPPILELRRIVASGALGTLLQIEANFSQDLFIGLPADNWRLNAKDAPGGPLTATGIHLVDLSCSIFGPAETVVAHNRARSGALPNGDSLSALVSFRNGATASITAMLATPFFSRFCVFGTTGWVEVRDKSHVQSPTGWWLTKSIGKSAPETVDHPVAAPVLTNLEAFADAIAGGAHYPVPHTEMLNTVALLEAIVRSTVASGAPTAVEAA